MKKKELEKCSQKQCAFNNGMAGCQTCKSCSAPPNQITNECLACWNCEYKAGFCRWGDDVKKNDVVDKTKTKPMEIIAK
jgi:hypothetical protein